MPKKWKGFAINRNTQRDFLKLFKQLKSLDDEEIQIENNKAGLACLKQFEIHF